MSDDEDVADKRATVRLPDAYRSKLEEHRVALGAKSGAKAITTLLDLPPAYLAKCVADAPKSASTPVDSKEVRRG